MVIHDLNIVGVALSPAEANPPLVVDADADLTAPISAQLLQSVGRRNPEVLQQPRGLNVARLLAGVSPGVCIELLQTGRLRFVWFLTHSSAGHDVVHALGENRADRVEDSVRRHVR